MSPATARRAIDWKILITIGAALGVSAVRRAENGPGKSGQCDGRGNPAPLGAGLLP
jgi:hypothetical protein